MSDYISKEKLMSHIESQYKSFGEDYDALQILGDIEDFPTEQRPHGEWIFKNGKYRCTACGEKAIYVYPGMSNIPKAILTDYCPKCGVQMNTKALEMIRKREGGKK